MEIRPAAPARAFVTPDQRRERRRVDPPRDRRANAPAPEDRGRLISRSLRGHVEGGFRPDVEGMRAIAVVAVVLYHFHFPLISGGFIGVDVFFVLSGFLITRLVLGELVDTGTISLPSFWGRRARRLLPASAAVVVVTVLIAQQVFPPLRLRDLARDTFGAATFTANFRFADSFGDYFGAELAQSNPSPLLHFWSLAVEEQFYLCWPPLLLLLARRPRQYRRLVLAAVGGIAVFSFLLGIWLTSHHQAVAFYLLPARMGELLAGAALAVVGSGLAVVPAVWRAAAGWVGLAAIGVACIAFEDGTPSWPGFFVLVPVARDDGRDHRGTGAVGAVVGRSVPVGPDAAVDRSTLLRALPVALAAEDPRRGAHRPADLAGADRHHRHVGRVLGALRAIARGPDPALPLAECGGAAKPGPRRGDVHPGPGRWLEPPVGGR